MEMIGLVSSFKAQFHCALDNCGLMRVDPLEKYLLRVYLTRYKEEEHTLFQEFTCQNNLLQNMCFKKQLLGTEQICGQGSLRKVELFWSAQAAITKIPETGGLKQQTFISHHSGGWEVQD